MAAHRAVEIRNIFFFYFFNDKEPNEACRWEIFNISMPSCVRFSGSPVKFHNFIPLHVSFMQYDGPFYINASLYRLFHVYFLSIGICQCKHILLFITA